MDDRFEELKKEWFSGKVGIRPIFLLAYGPPGSGKTTAIRRFLENEGENYKNYVRIILDDIIEKDEAYKKEVQIVMDDPSRERQEKIDAAQEVYFRYRKNAGLLSEHMLDVAVRQRFNVIFESTGSDRSINWSIYMFRHMMANGYKTWVFYPWASIDRILSRVDARSAQNGRMIPHDYVKEINRQAQLNFESIAVLADAVWFFDNNNDDNSGQFITHFINEYNVNTGRENKSHCKFTRFPKEIEPALKEYLVKRCNLA